MKRNFLTKAFVCLFTVVTLCSCNEDDDKSKACDITSFVVNDTVWNIVGENITHTYPPEMPKTSLSPTITLSPGATVNPPATEAKNFFTEQGVTYTVTAEDGETTKTYTVKATVQVGDDEQSVISNPLIVVVENGNNYNDEIDVVKAEIYSESGDNVTLASAPYENGGFTLNLPESVDAQYLESFEFKEGELEGITVSNPDAKAGWVDLHPYKSNSVIGYFYNGIGDWDGELVYLDSDYNMTGSHTESETYEEVTYTYKTTYNIHGKKGWNMVYYKETDNGNNSEEYEMTTSVPVGAKWYFYSYSSEQSSVSGSLLKPKTLSAKRTFGLK